jgi:hypothetical protein
MKPEIRKFVGRKFQNATVWIGLNLVTLRIFGYIFQTRRRFPRNPPHPTPTIRP